MMLNDLQKCLCNPHTDPSAVKADDLSATGSRAGKQLLGAPAAVNMSRERDNRFLNAMQHIVRHEVSRARPAP
jgi:hypothetical protein